MLPKPSRALTETPFFRSQSPRSALPVRTAECKASAAVGIAGAWAGDDGDANQSTTSMAAPRIMPQRSTRFRIRIEAEPERNKGRSSGLEFGPLDVI